MIRKIMFVCLSVCLSVCVCDHPRNVQITIRREIRSCIETMVTMLNANVHVQIFASAILIGFVVITLCSIRASFNSAVSSVVTDILRYDET